MKINKSFEEAGDAPQEIQLPDSIVLGSCAVDLLPLLLGKSQYYETYLICRPANQRKVDTNVPNISSIPRVKVEVGTFDNQPILSNINILHLTLESIYNIPEVMAWPQMRHRVAVSLPLSNSVRYISLRILLLHIHKFVVIFSNICDYAIPCICFFSNVFIWLML